MTFRHVRAYAMAWLGMLRAGLFRWSVTGWRGRPVRLGAPSLLSRVNVAGDDVALIAWFVRDEPLWRLLLGRWKLRRAKAGDRVRIASVAMARLRAGQDRESHRLKQHKKRSTIAEMAHAAQAAKDGQP